MSKAKKGKALAKKPRIYKVGNSVPQLSWTTSRPVVLTVVRECGRGKTLVACAASHFGKDTTPIFTNYFLANGLDHDL